MPRLDRLPQINRNTLLTFPSQVNDTTPFTALPRPLAGCRVGIVTTAGLHRRGDRPFGSGDQSYRVIPSDTPTADILQRHTSIGFDRVPLMLRWFWAETGMGQLLRRGRDRLDAADDPRSKAAAFGIAR